MSGRIGRNLRQGHKAEGLGVELLRPFCAVATVPQAEDIGFDAVATLLRIESGFLYAEDSFCVQFKAKSVRKVSYDPHEYDWLRELTLPLFIGSVNLRSRKIALYTTHAVASRVDRFSAAVMYLDQRETHFERDIVHQSIGPPILQWTAEEGEQEDFQRRAYDILKAWVNFENLNRQLRAIRTTQQIQWQTNEVPHLSGMMSMGHPSEIQRDLEAAIPYLSKIGMHFLSSEEISYGEFGFFLLALWLKEKEIADGDVLSKLLEAKVRHHYAKINFTKIMMQLEVQIENSS